MSRPAAPKANTEALLREGASVKGDQGFPARRVMQNP
jgi:hypothetical protein